MKHAGMLRQLLTDDKGTVAILVWGCFDAHTDDPSRAARAALELCAALRGVPAEIESPSPLVVAAGVTTGWAFAGNIGNCSRAEYVVMGDIVNCSARLMGLATSLSRGLGGVRGGVMCDRATRESLLAADVSRTSSDGAIVIAPEVFLAIKGKSSRVGVTELTLELPATPPRADSTSSHDCRSADVAACPAADPFVLVGRTAELRQLSDLSARYLAAPSSSTCIVLEGRQGMGKVRMGLGVVSGSK